MSITSEITRIKNNISSAYTSLESKGATLPEAQNSANLVNTIDSIPSSGGGETTSSVLKLMDWEGTILKEYNKEEALALEALPDPSTLDKYSEIDHNILTFQEWNWSLEGIKAWVNKHEDETLLVGAVYTTSWNWEQYDHDDPKMSEYKTATCVKVGYKASKIDMSGFYSLKKINIPKKSSGSYDKIELYDCASLEYLIQPTKGGSAKCLNSRSLKYVSLPENCTGIAMMQFQKCYSLSSINIPDGVKGIYDQAFAYCYSLTSIRLPEELTYIGTYVFREVPLSSIEIPSKVTTIGAAAFYNCCLLSSINLSNGLTTIEDGAFENCYSLSSIDIPDGVTSIGSGAFRSCACLLSVKLPEELTAIQNSTFYQCYALTNICIPEKVTTIGSQAFSGLNRYMELKDILMKGKPTLSNTNAFNYNRDTQKFYVPRENLSWFETATNWSTLYSRFVAIEDNIAYLESLGYNVDAYK